MSKASFGCIFLIVLWVFILCSVPFPKYPSSIIRWTPLKLLRQNTKAELRVVNQSSVTVLWRL